MTTSAPNLLRLFLAAAGLCVTAAARADHTPTLLQKQGPVSLTTTAKVRDGQIEIRLSGTLVLTLALDAPVSEVKVPAPLTSSEAWKVRADKPIQEKDSWRQTFVLIPLAPAKHALQLEPFEYQETSGTWRTVTWKPIAVEVTTQVTKADVSELRDITDIEHVPGSPSPWDWGKWVVAGTAGLGIAVAATLLWRRRRRKPAPVLTPEQWACRELERVVALNLPGAGELERYHTLLSNVIRRYLEKRFHLPARRQTTPEFLQTMENAPQLSAAQQSVLREFLERCDLAKFAALQPSVEKCRETADMAHRLVEPPSLPDGS